MRTRAGDFKISSDVAIADTTVLTFAHNDPSGNVEIEYDFGSKVSAASASSRYWASDHKGGVFFRFSTFTAYMTELEVEGMLAEVVDQLPSQLTKFHRNAGYLTSNGVRMAGTSLPAGLVDLRLENVQSPADVDRIITALETNNQSSGTLFIAEQRLSKSTALLESRSWDVEIEPDIVHHVGKSVAPHTSIIDGKVVHHVDRRRGGDRRKQFEGRCIELNGSSEYGTGPGFDASAGDFTASIWFKVQTSSSNQDMLNQHGYSANQSSWLLSINSSGNVASYVMSDPAGLTNYIGIVTSGSYDDDEWHHAAMVVDGLSLRLYVDGVDQGAATNTSGTYSGPHNSTDPIRMGVNSTVSNTRYVTGKLKHPRIYDTALTDAQIAALAAEAPQKPLATSLPTPLIDLPMDDATSSPIIRNHGSLGQSGDFALTGTPSSIWTTCDRVSLPNEHGCSVGLVTPGTTDSYVDTGITLNGATAFTVIKKFRPISNGAYDLDGFYNAGGASVRIGRNTGDYDLAFNYGDASTFVTPDVTVARGEYLSLAMTAEVGGNYDVLKDGASVSSGVATGFSAISNSKSYLIGASNDASIGNAGAHEIVGYLIADRALSVGEIEFYLTDGASGTPFDSATDPNILGDYDFQSPNPHTVRNLADPGNPAKIVGGCEWTAINRDAANPTQDMNGKALTFSGPVPRSAKILSPVATLNGTSEYIESISPVDLGGSELTASVRFKTTDADGGYLFALWDYNNSDRVFQLGINVDGNITALISHDGSASNLKFLTTTGSFDDGEWHVAEMTFDSGTLKLWVDKVEQVDAIDASVGTTTQVFSVSKEVTAGDVWGGVGGNSLSGSISDCKLSTTAATDDQVVAGTWDADVIDWPLCEGSGNVAHDTSGNGNHGDITGSVWDGDQQNKSDVLITSGFAKGTIFDGSSDYFSRANLLGGSTKLCVSLWMRVDSLASTAIAIGEYVTTGDQRGFLLVVETDGKVRITVSENGTTVANASTATSVITAGQLHHISMTFDAGTVAYEIDGIAVGTVWSDTARTFVYNSTATFEIGAYNGGATPFPGTLSQLLIHKDPTAIWTSEQEAAIRAAGTTEDIADIVENLGGTAWWFPDGDSNETLQGLTSGWTTNGSPTETVIPAGAGVPISYGPGVPAPGQSRLIAPEPNSPFALRYAKDYQLDEGALAYEAVFPGSTNRVDLGSALIGATDDFDISLDFIADTAGVQQFFFSQYTAGVAGRLAIQQMPDNTLLAFIDGTTDIALYTASTITSGKWYTVRLTRVGDVFTLYLDGTEEASQTQSGITVQQKNTMLGTDYASYKDFDGKIRNVRVDNNGTVTERLTQNIALPGATLTNVTVNSVNHGVVGGRQLFFNSDGTANLYETPMSAEMTEVIQKLTKKYS